MLLQHVRLVQDSEVPTSFNHLVGAGEQRGGQFQAKRRGRLQVYDELKFRWLRPGGNVTGASQFNNVLGPKRIELLHELVPNAATIGMIVNPSAPAAESQLREAQRRLRRS
jgi:hypothetical protein